METKKLNKFLFVVLAILLFACYNPQSENPPLITNNLSLGHKTDMTLVDSTNGNLTFLDTVKINEFKYIVKCVYKNDYDYPFFQLIKNGDTIEFERDGLYVTDSIYDVNNDNRDDLNIKYQATKGFIIVSYLFDKETNKLSTKPDTIYVQNQDSYFGTRFERSYFAKQN